MSITFDYGSRSVLAVCSCGWRELCGNRVAASAAAVDHVERVHAQGRAPKDMRERHDRIAASAANKRRRR